MNEWTPGTLEYLAEQIPLNECGQTDIYLAKQILLLQKRIEALENKGPEGYNCRLCGVASNMGFHSCTQR